MVNELKQLIEDIKLENLREHDEASISQTVVLEILRSLGWNTRKRDEVHPEFKFDDRKKVDYALKDNNLKHKVFIEVKRGSEDLEIHQEQLIFYSHKYSVRIAILTNGILWWFYLPMLDEEIDWREKKFCILNITNQDAEEIADKLIAFLSKENVLNGEAIKVAKDVWENENKSNKINKHIPIAWNEIITEPSEILINLIADKTEKLCGLKPENEIIIEFIKNGFNSRNKFENVEIEEEVDIDGTGENKNDETVIGNIQLKIVGINDYVIFQNNNMSYMKGKQHLRNSNPIFDAIENYIMKYATKHNVKFPDVDKKNKKPNDCFYSTWDKTTKRLVYRCGFYIENKRINGIVVRTPKFERGEKSPSEESNCTYNTPYHNTFSTSVFSMNAAVAVLEASGCIGVKFFLNDKLKHITK